MSRPIADITDNLQAVRAGEKYGIEVEGEGCAYERREEFDWSAAFQRYWNMTSDGSLRNGGIEFLSKPLLRTAVPPAIESLWPYFDAGRVHGSVRTGVHIHCNMVGKTVADTFRILEHYALLEPQLFDFVGKEREENIYCIPWYRAHDEPTAVRAWLGERDNDIRAEGLPRAARSPCKYSALYVGPITRLGTIEFRHAPTFTDRTQMLHWWQMVQCMWHTVDTTYDVLTEWQRLGPTAFAKQVFKGLTWMQHIPEQVYEDVDVESVLALLRPSKPVIANTWGMAPELKGPGVAMAATPTRLRTPTWREPEEPELTAQDIINRERQRMRDRLIIDRNAVPQPTARRGVRIPLPTTVESMWATAPPTLTVNVAANEPDIETRVAAVQQEMMDAWMDEIEEESDDDYEEYGPENEEEEF